MKIINLTKKEFESLELLKLSKEITNTEAIIYKLNYKKEPKILKCPHYLNGPIFANKLYTIEMLDTNRQYLPENFYTPDYLLNINGSIHGFTIPYMKGTNLSTILHKSNTKEMEKIYYLKKIGEMLEQINNIRTYTPLKDFYINDLHESNFIVNTDNRSIGVIDLDSAKIGSNIPSSAKFLSPRSLAVRTSDKYQIKTDEDGLKSIIPDENSDLYCYIVMILNYLIHSENVSNMEINEFNDYLNYLEIIGINKELINIFSKIITKDKNINPVNYLDSLTEPQIYRSRSLVYNKVKSKILN